MNGNIVDAIGIQSGIQGVFTAQFGLLWLLALVFGVCFAVLVTFARKHEILPTNPGDSAGFVVIGVAGTGFIAGFWIGWLPVVELMLFFMASGVPMLVESKISEVAFKRDHLRNQMDLQGETQYDTSEALAE